MTTPRSDDDMVKHLQEAFALERLSLRVLEEGCRSGNDRMTIDIYTAHAQQTRGHLRLLQERLNAHSANPPSEDERSVQVAGIKLDFDRHRASTPAHLAMNALTVENMEIGVYQFLLVMARQARDLETETVVRQILEQEEDAAELVASRIYQAAAETELI